MTVWPEHDLSVAHFELTLAVCSHSLQDPKKIEDAMVEAINNGARLICVHYMTSDLPYHGAKAVAEPFWNACKRTGFA